MSEQKRLSLIELEALLIRHDAAMKQRREIEPWENLLLVVAPPARLREESLQEAQRKGPRLDAKKQSRRELGGVPPASPDEEVNAVPVKPGAKQAPASRDLDHALARSAARKNHYRQRAPLPDELASA